MIGMDKTEFDQLLKSLDSMRKFLTSTRTVAYPADPLRSVPLPNNYMQSLVSLVKDARRVAQMASQALDREQLNVVQQIALKASLSQLEFEIRIGGA